MADVGLARVGQNDLSAGMFQGTARHLIPPNGAYDLINFLLDDDGSAYRRGGTVAKSNAYAGRYGIADAVLAPGQRTVSWDNGNTYALGADDTTPVQIGGNGLNGPVRAVAMNGFLFLSSDDFGSPAVAYGGSRKTSGYNYAGSFTVTNGSPVVTLATGALLANVDAGMLMDDPQAPNRVYIVKSVDSNTQLTLTENYLNATHTASGMEFAVFWSLTNSGYHSGKLAVVANRLVVMAPFGDTPDEIRFSAVNDPHTYDPTDFHKLPGGVNLIGGERVGDRLLAFASNGIWMVSNMALSLTDAAGNPQQRLEQVNQDIVAISHAGIGSYRGALVVPAQDGVWMVDGVSAPVELSRSIRKLYRDYIAAGYTAGGATVFRGHYMLPILNFLTIVDYLVCRLDRPASAAQGTIFPWTRLAGAGGKISAMAVRASVKPPLLLGISNQADGKVVRMESFFSPISSVKNDHDGTTHAWTYISRDFAGGAGPVTWRRVRARSEGIDAAADNPTFTATISTGPAFGAAMSGAAPESDGRLPYAWSFQANGRHVRVKLTSSQPWASFTLREVELSFRQSPKV